MDLGEEFPRGKGVPFPSRYIRGTQHLDWGFYVTIGGVDFAPLLREVSAASLSSCCLSHPYSVHFFFFLDVWAIFKVFIDFVTILFLFYILVFLARRHVGS